MICSARMPSGPVQRIEGGGKMRLLTRMLGRLSIQLKSLMRMLPLQQRQQRHK